MNATIRTSSKKPKAKMTFAESNYLEDDITDASSMRYCLVMLAMVVVLIVLFASAAIVVATINSPYNTMVRIITVEIVSATCIMLGDRMRIIWQEWAKRYIAYEHARPFASARLALMAHHSNRRRLAVVLMKLQRFGKREST